jgi:hypothetical protein
LTIRARVRLLKDLGFSDSFNKKAFCLESIHKDKFDIHLTDWLLHVIGVIVIVLNTIKFGGEFLNKK